MALVVKDRVQETSTTTGTGALTLLGAVTGFQTFSSAIGNTNTTYYTIQNGGEWEVGIGTVSAGALSRDTVLESSNGGSLVNFSAGTKFVFCTYPAEKSVDIETAQTLTNKTISGASNTLSNIGNSSLTNSAITINGTSTALGGSINVGTVTSVTGTAPVVSSGGNTPAISMAAATTSVNGYLTSTDWNTFNGKQAALVSGTNIKTVNSNSLLGSGNVAVGTVTSVGGTGSYGGLTLSGTVTTSGNITLGGTPTGTWPISITGASTSCSGNAATATTAVSATTPTFTGDSVDKDNITTRTDSGFYQTSTGTTAEGWPVTSNEWQHLIACTHNNDANYYSMQIAGSFYDNEFYGRKTNGSGSTAWVNFVTSGNYSSYGITRTTGSTPYYGARAWVNFNGIGTVSIRASGNVSSITDNGTGSYTLNYSTAMPDTNYATVTGFGGFQNGDIGGETLAVDGGASNNWQSIGLYSTTQTRMIFAVTLTEKDLGYVFVAVFR